MDSVTNREVRDAWLLQRADAALREADYVLRRSQASNLSPQLRWAFEWCRSSVDDLKALAVDVRSGERDGGRLLEAIVTVRQCCRDLMDGVGDGGLAVDPGEVDDRQVPLE